MIGTAKLSSAQPTGVSRAHARSEPGGAALRGASARDPAERIESFLGAGACGILASGVESADDVRTLLAAVKRTKELTLIAALIESRRAIEQLDSILAVPELDCVAVGPNDLGRSIGTTEGARDQRVRMLVDVADRAIAAAGKKRMTVVVDAEAASRAIDGGALLIAVPDATLIARAGKEFVARAPARTRLVPRRAGSTLAASDTSSSGSFAPNQPPRE